MRDIDFIFRTLSAELAQRVACAAESEFDTDGRFVPVTVKGRRYWYFDYRGARGSKVRTYVGPDDNETIRQTVAQFRDLKDGVCTRRKIVRMLTREANLPAPDPVTGRFIQRLAEAGLFKKDCVLIERNAYQCFAAYLGVQLPRVSWERKPPGICLSIRAAADIVTVQDVLKTADRSFAPEPYFSGRQGDVCFVNSEGFWIELAAPTLLGAYLVEEPTKTVILYKSGIEVTVPRPERYALHELMMSARADADFPVREYSRERALAVMQALLDVRHQADLAEAYEAAWDRNDTWRGLIERGIASIDDIDLQARILEGLTRGLKEIGHDPPHVHSG